MGNQGGNLWDGQNQWFSQVQWTPEVAQSQLHPKIPPDLIVILFSIHTRQIKRKKKKMVCRVEAPLHSIKMSEI